MMHGHHGPMGPGEKAKNFKGTIAKLIRYMRPYYAQIIIIVLFAVGSTIFGIIGPRILGSATTTLAEGLVAKYSGTGSIDFAKIGNILKTLLGIYICSVIFNYFQGWLMAGVTQSITYRLRKEISEKINRMPLKYFDTQTHGEVLSRITNDVAVVSQSLNQSIQQVFTSLVTICGVLYMMLSISWQLTIMALVVVPLSGICAAFVVTHSQKYFKASNACGNACTSSKNIRVLPGIISTPVKALNPRMILAVSKSPSYMACRLSFLSQLT